MYWRVSLVTAALRFRGRARKRLTAVTTRSRKAATLSYLENHPDEYTTPLKFCMESKQIAISNRNIMEYDLADLIFEVSS